MTKAQRKIAVDHLLDGARGRRTNAARYRSLARGGGLCTNYLVDAKWYAEESSALFAAAKALRKVACDE